MEVMANMRRAAIHTMIIKSPRIWVLAILTGCCAAGNEACDAKHWWEESLRARGNLGAIRTFAITSVYGESRNPSRKASRSGVVVYGMGNKSWSWHTYGDVSAALSRMFPPSATLVDLDKGIYSQFGNSDAEPAFNPDAEGAWVNVLVKLPDSKWASPKVVDCIDEGSSTLTIRGEWRRFTIEYSMSKATLLPNEVRIWHPRPGKGGRSASIARFRLSDYRPVEGVVLPHRIDVQNLFTKEWVATHETYEVNPPIHPLVFDNRLRPELGPEQWRAGDAK